MAESDEETIVKPKRVLTEKQKEAFDKCIAARKQNTEARKGVKVEKEVTEKLSKLDVKAEKLIAKLPAANRPAPVRRKVPAPPPPPQSESSSETETEYVVMPRSKPKKKRIVVVQQQESDTDSEPEVIVKRKPPVSRPTKPPPPPPLSREQSLFFC